MSNILLTSLGNSYIIEHGRAIIFPLCFETGSSRVEFVHVRGTLQSERPPVHVHGKRPENISWHKPVHSGMWDSQACPQHCVVLFSRTESIVTT